MRRGGDNERDGTVGREGKVVVRGGGSRSRVDACGGDGLLCRNKTCGYCLLGSRVEIKWCLTCDM